MRSFNLRTLSLAALISLSFLFSSLPTLAQGCINPKASPYNAVGDNITDDTAAIDAAIVAACAAGQPLCVPNGSPGYKVTTLAPVTCALSIVGSSPTQTIINTVSSTGDVLTLAHAGITLSHIGFNTSVIRSAGAFVLFDTACTGCSIDDWTATFPYIAVAVASTSGVHITRGDIQFSSAGTGSAGVEFRAGTSHVLSSLNEDVNYLGTPPSPLPIPYSGVHVTGAVSNLSITSARIRNAVVCYRFESGTGISLTSSTCDGATVNGVRAQPVTGNVSNLSITDVGVTNSTGNGMVFAGGSGGTISNIAVAASRVDGSHSNGIAITNGVTYATVSNSTLTNNVAAGVHVMANVSNWSVQSCTINGSGTYGVVNDPGTSDYIRNIGNDLHGNTLGAFSIAGTGTHITSANNL